MEESQGKPVKVKRMKVIGRTKLIDVKEANMDSRLTSIYSNFSCHGKWRIAI